MSFRLAAYAVCVEGPRVLLVRCPAPGGGSVWSLPGGHVEFGEDPFDAVRRELTEETGYVGMVDRLLGVDSRVIPATESAAGETHQNVGIFYRVRVTGGVLRAEQHGTTVEPAWTENFSVATLHRSSLVDVGLTLAQTVPATGHVPPVPTGGHVHH